MLLTGRKQAKVLFLKLAQTIYSYLKPISLFISFSNPHTILNAF